MASACDKPAQACDGQSADRGAERPRFFQHHWVLIVLLWVAAMIPRAIGLSLAVAPARDSFRFFATAQSFDHWSAVETARKIPVHPLYPYTLWACHRAVVSVTGVDGPFVWYYVAQGWSLLCYLGFLTCAYWAGCLLWNRQLSFWGCVALAMVPRQITYSIDVLADNLHAMLWMASVACLLTGWRRPAWGWFLPAGVFAGLAYWTRVEALMVPLALGSAAVVTMLVPRWRWSWKPALAGTLAFTIPWIMMVGGYANLIGRISPRNSAMAILGGQTQAEAKVGTVNGKLKSSVPDAKKTGGSPTNTSRNKLETGLENQVEDGPATKNQVKSPKSSANQAVNLPVGFELITHRYRRQEGYIRNSWTFALQRLVREIGQETRVWLFLFAVLGWLAVGPKQLRWPMGWLPVFASLGTLAMLIILQVKAGYLAGRYLTPILPFLSISGMVGVQWAIGRLMRLPRFAWEKTWSDADWNKARRLSGIGGVILLAGILCIPDWFRPLHRHRAGHMQAAQWLKEHTGPNEVVFDPSAFSSHFANRPRWAPLYGIEPVTVPTRYAAIDPSEVYRTDRFTHQGILDVHQRGTPVAYFRRKPGDKRLGMIIYQMPVSSGQLSRASTDGAPQKVSSTPSGRRR